MIRKSRLASRIIPSAALALLAALWAGLVRIGWGLPPLLPALPGAHGPLLVCGFLGTVIAVERAVALNRRWTYVGPLFTGVGALALIVTDTSVGAALMTIGSLNLVAVFVLIVRRHPALHTAVMGGGALLWMVGNALWMAGQSIAEATPWWLGFIVLTIAGERLELNRVLRLSRGSLGAFLGAVFLLLAGVTASVSTFKAGTQLAGAGMIALALWLLRYDVARRTIKKGGLTGFIAACVLSGYVWLGIGGALALRFGGLTAGPYYDAQLHSVFLGFVFAMIFGHAPIIFPAILGREMAYRSLFYAHLALLHFSLLLRVVGDLTGVLPARQWGGLLNVVALLLFLANTVRSLRAGPRSLAQ